MQITIEIPDGEILNLAKEIMQNMPECSLSLRCVGWKYEKGIYVFVDEDDEDDIGKRYTVTVEEIAAKGLKTFIEKTVQGEYQFCGCANLENVLDACCYDADIIDTIIQLTIFGKVIYG